MTALAGTRVTSKLVPFDTQDTYGTHDSMYGVGGYREVATTAARDAITGARRRAGMLVYVAADDTIYKLGSDLSSWSALSLSPSPTPAPSSGVSMPVTTVLDCVRLGAMDDPASTITTGTGDFLYRPATSTTDLLVGSQAHQPGRIYTSGRNLMNAGRVIYMNGANTPWYTFNEFGATGSAGHAAYNHAWWAAEFARIKNRGLNSTRVWIVDDPSNEGVTLNSDGSVNDVTSLFWANLNDMLDLARTNGVYVKVSVMTFDCFTWNNSGAERWHHMLGKLSNVQQFCTKFLVPLAQISVTNPYLYCIDLGNEVDNFFETMETATPRNGTCTPVGGGSKVVNFGQRLDDLLVGTQLYVNGVSMGLITIRNSDTQCTCQNGYPGASASFSAGVWGFNGKLPATYQRYIAYASAAIHALPVGPLVTVGVQSIKFSTSAYGASDYYSDTVLSSFTGSAMSKIDLHSIHYYQWCEVFFPLVVTPTAAGLSNKPATYGELPMAWQNLNGTGFSGQWIYAWRPRLYYSVGACVYTDDGTNKRLYRCVTPGYAGPTAGTAGGDIGPTGTGSGIADGGAVWDWCPNNSTFEGNFAYTAYRACISYDGGLWVCTTAGNTGNEGGPYGTGPTWTSSAATNPAVFTYLRQVILDERTLFDWLLSNGWAGHYPWESSNFSVNGGLYEVDYANQIIADWAPDTVYPQDALVLHDSGKIYRALSTTGTSASTGGPTGTGVSITDGSVTWAYARTSASATSSPAWTHAGMAIKAFSDANSSTVFPDTSGPWDNTGKVVRQSRTRAWYAYGTDIQFSLGVAFIPGEAGLTQRAGAFDDADGLFVLASGTTPDLSLVVRSAGVDTAVARADWNVNKLDGSGTPALTLDLTKPQFPVISSGGQHGGHTRIGFLFDGSPVWCHEFKVGNSVLSLPSNPNHPIRWELEAATPLASPKTLVTYSGGASAASDSQRRNRRSSPTGRFLQINGSTLLEAMAVRVAPSFVRYSTIQPVRVSFKESTEYQYDIFEWRLVLNPVFSGPGAWSPASASGTVAEVNLTRNMNRDTGATIASGSGGSKVDVDLSGITQELGATADGVADILSLQVWNLTQQQLYFTVEMDWIEVR